MENMGGKLIIMSRAKDVAKSLLSTEISSWKFYWEKFRKRKKRTSKIQADF